VIGPPHRVFGGLVLVYLGVAGTLLVRFPPVNPDEITACVAADNFIHGKGPKYSLNDDIFSKAAYAVHDVSNVGSRLVYLSWLGLWARLFPHNYIALRWSSLSLGFGALLFLYLTGIALGGTALGLAFVTVTLAYPAFWASSLCVNELMALFFACSGLLWLTAARQPRRWRHFILGGIAGLCFGIHPTVVPFCMGWSILLVGMESGERPWVHFVLMTLGGVAGVILALSRVDWSHFLLYQQSFYWVFAQPPILSWPWHPGLWLQSTLITWLNPPTFFFKSNWVWGWTPAFRLFWGGVVLSLLQGLLRRDKTLGPWLGALGLTVVGMAMLIRRQEMAYGLVFAPFLIPLVGLSWRQEGYPQSKAIGPLRILSGGCFVGGFVCFLLFSCCYAWKTKPFHRIAVEIRSLVPQPPGNIAGPNLLWLVYGGGQVRDLGAVFVSRYYTEGRWNLQESFATWKPDVLFVNPLFRRIFIRFGATELTLPRLMGAETVKPLGHVEMYSVDDSYDLYSVRWPRKKTS